VAERRGGTVLARNYRKNGGEVDLVVETSDRVIAFVEVKTRTTDAFGSGLESVTRGKQRRVARAAVAFIGEHGLGDRACRFDVAVVEPSGDRCSVRWLEGAFSVECEEELQ
jgi:putative endonuclease